MLERRSLLDFAIGASMAVLPVMLGVLLLVAVIRPVDLGTGAAPWRTPQDRYVSVRQVAALKTFEQAVVARTIRPAALPDALAIENALPECRKEKEWQPAQVAAHLAALDAALQRFSTRPNPRVAQPVGLDGERWLVLARRSLVAPVEAADYPGRSFHVGCADLAGALAALLRSDARMLDALAWRGTVSAAALARWAPQQQVEINARHVMRRNPWSGIAGCVYLGAPAGPPSHVINAAGAVPALCGQPALSGSPTPPQALAGDPGPQDAVDDPRWSVPPSLAAMLEPLEALRQPSRPLYRLYTEVEGAEEPVSSGTRLGPNRVALNGAPVDVGFSLRLTIDPALQALAQKTAACYTGRHEVCQALGLRRAEDGTKPPGGKLLEGAMVRMAAVAVVDVASGRIEALAGALSPCARQEVDGPGRDAQCDKRLPYPVRYRPDLLLNPAVYHDAMPASTIKPIMAAAFLNDSPVGRRWLAAERQAMQRPGAPARDSLRGQLMRSDSARFLDRMLCLDLPAGEPCRRPWEIQAEALAFGWNAGCPPPGTSGDVRATNDCGRHDLLFGQSPGLTPEVRGLQPLATRIAYGRLLSEPLSARLGAAMRLKAPLALDPGIVRRCAAGADGARGSDDDWEKCRGGAVVDVVAEGWGQGHARASALGVAGMMATLAAAANGQTEVQRPHLVDGIRGAGEGAAIARWAAAAPVPVGVPREAAEVILSGLSYSHREGTARTACEQVFDAKRCREIGWLAGKTGTPSFPNDGLTLDQLARACRDGAAAPSKRKDGADRAISCSSLRPYKWYVAAWRSDPGGPWTKVIAVLAERNWLRASGVVHGAGDRGPNPAAEIALQIVGRQVGAIPGTAP